MRNQPKTWQELLDFFLRTKNYEFRDEGAREEAMIEMMEYTLQKILEKLRDEHGEL